MKIVVVAICNIAIIAMVLIGTILIMVFLDSGIPETDHFIHP